jgi:energy-coupling factor transporter ATP-binding protein EcfA2
MAHITDISIEGLLGREEPIRVSLKRGVNVFFGENGCGKTTLLKVLDAALSRDGTAMERLPVTKATIDIYSITEDRVLRHTWERREPEPLRPMTARQLELLAAESEYIDTPDGRIVIRRSRADSDWKLSPNEKNPSSSRWSHTFLPTTRLYFGESATGRYPGSRAQSSETELDDAFAESVNRAWLQFYSRTLNEVRSIQESGLRAVLRHVLNPTKEEAENSSQDAAGVYARVVNFLARQPQSEHITLGSQSTFRRRYETDANLRRVVDNLDVVERSIEQAMVPVNRFLDTTSRLFSRGKKLGLTNTEMQVLLADGRVLPIAQLSSGEKHLIKILLASMTAGPNSVLVDEPELSMHIDWQRILAETILSLNPDCQLILASHSPEIMADVPDECIFKL